MSKNSSKKTGEWPEFLDKNILDVLNNDLGFKSMTPVQSVVVPIFTQQHKDVVVEAVTGSGKTLAFVVPIIEILLKRNKQQTLKKHEIGALIISPTRELALQIYTVVEAFLKKITNFSSILLVGGNNLVEDINRFEKNGGNIMVGTSGRLEDLFTRENLNFRKNFKSLEVLILDEADRLLDLGFHDSLETILKYLPKQRRTGLFSATQTNEIDKLVRAGLRNPCSIQVKQKADVNAQKTPLGLKNYYTMVQPEEKFHKLVEFLRTKKKLKTIIFMSTCACVQYFSTLLKSFLKDTEVLALHRKIKDKRTKIYSRFKSLEKGVLVCTDILARGIDIEDVDWVVQYDPPKSASSFVHRCGRTARSGREGNAIIFLLPNEDSYVNFILINQQVPLEKFVQTNSDPNALDITIKKMHTIESKEREIYEKGKEAFVSYIRAYSKHDCSHIFQIKELDLKNLAKGFGLLHMPKMPEISRADSKFELSTINTSTIPYKNKKLENERQEKMANKSIEKVKKSITTLKNKPWSNEKEKKLKKKIKKEKMVLVEKKRKHDDDDEIKNDLKELQDDFRMLKKLKRKKISEDDFNKCFDQ